MTGVALLVVAAACAPNTAASTTASSASTSSTSPATTSSTAAPTTTTQATTTTTAPTTTTTTEAQVFTVAMADNVFQPMDLTVPLGSTVVWTNTGNNPHTTTSGNGSNGTPNGLWDSGIANPGGSFSYTFDAPGLYTYYCTIHWAVGMVGTITVTG